MTSCDQGWRACLPDQGRRAGLDNHINNRDTDGDAVTPRMARLPDLGWRTGRDNHSNTRDSDDDAMTLRTGSAFIGPAACAEPWHRRSADVEDAPGTVVQRILRNVGCEAKVRIASRDKMSMRCMWKMSTNLFANVPTYVSRDVCAEHVLQAEHTHVTA